jgi:hypothetical protein
MSPVTERTTLALELLGAAALLGISRARARRAVREAAPCLKSQR